MPLKTCGSVSVRLQWLDAAGVLRRHRRLAAQNVDRRSPLRSRLGQHERSIREVECSQPDLARDLGVRREPAEAAGDHEVDDDEELAFQADDDPFSDPAE
jgi:hypothetical protein